MSWSPAKSMRCLGCLAAFIVAGTFSLSAQAQGPGGRGGPGGGFGGGFGGFGGFGGGGPLALLQREDVQQELELLEDQKTQLRAMGEKSRERMGELFRRGGPGGGGGGQGNDRRDELRDTFRKFNEETQADLDKILLPHQSKRLKQLEVQMRMRGRVMGALDGEVAQQLGISEDQQDKLREKAQGLEQELRKKTAEIRKQLQDQLLAELSTEQRKQFNDMVGDPFEFKDEAPGGFGGPGGGGFGGFGGNREQGRGGNDRRRRPDEQK